MITGLVLRSSLFLLLACAPGLVRAQAWEMDPGTSSLSLIAQLYGAPFEASFEAFEADIVFDPNNLAEARVTARINTLSMTAAVPEDAIYVTDAQGADWLSSDAFPIATFESQSFTDLGGGSYQVDGLLTIREQSTPVSFDFTLDFNGQSVAMAADFSLNRFDFGLGALTHPNENTVEASVTMALRLNATRF